MGEYIVLIAFFLIFIWGWRRVYLHAMRKTPRPVVAHMLGLLLALFPARFFVYAAFAIAPPEGAEPVSDTKTLMLCSLFVISIVALHILTRKRAPKTVMLSSQSGNASADDDAPGRS
ncbi:hypothetical protein LJC19_03920 [Oxalobacter sp. OttesenSCG-928-P03]|nr:hypothetical protein [Oxalobacter sp. OttesenSCG-928-P03]